MKCLLNEDNTILLSDFLKKIKEKDEEKNSKNKIPYLKGSISNYSKNLIMTFPAMCDNSLSPSTASMLSRANERNIVTMLQLLFSSAQFNGTDGVEVLSTVHKNINTNMSLDDYIDALDSIAQSAESYKKNAESYTTNESASIKRLLIEMQNQLKIPQKSFPVESFSEKSLNEYSVHNIHGRIVVKEESEEEKININYSDKDIKAMNAGDLERARQELQIKQMQKNMKNDAKKDARDTVSQDIKLQNMKHQNSTFATDVVSKQLLDSDVKKANEMVPTLMIVRYNELDSDGKIFEQKPFVAGVKSRLISVDSSDIVERLIVKNKTKIDFLNFIRATTGEIKFVKDFLLCINQAKINAKNSVKKGPAAKMWDVLENRSIKNNWNKLKRRGNDASAITTLIINQETVNIMKKEFDFDLEQVKNARMILEAYNLLGIIIADESIDVAKFLYAGNDTWEQQAYSYLEKESNDNSYKKVINLLNKTGR